MVSKQLLSILVCPEDKAGLIKKGNSLICKKCKTSYPIREGIPIMLK
ncbi:MAG: Trm112 family protein [Candidatus Woesearchaeota archaeon]